MAARSGKAKRKVWFDTVLENNRGVATFGKAQQPLNKHQRRGF